jgi:hypothetical protein
MLWSVGEPEEATMVSQLRQHCAQWKAARVICATGVVLLFMGLVSGACLPLFAQPAKVITRAAFERLYFPDTLGKMEVHWLAGQTYKVWATKANKPDEHYNFPVDIVQGRYGNPLTGAKAYGFRATYTLVDTGYYTVTRSSRFVAENGAVKDSSASWRLHIVLPTLLAPLTPDTVYYPGENPVIAFATREFPEAHGYTYSIWQGATLVDTGAGSNIFLQKFVNDPTFVSNDKVYEARGYYDGRIFSYTAGGDNAMRQSIWRFRIGTPVLDDMGVLWSTDASAPIDSLPVLPMGMNSAYNPRLFGFAYLTPKGSAFIFTNVRITNLRVQSDPEDFLGSHAGPIYGTTWTDIIIAPDPTFLQTEPRNEAKLVTLRFVFDTQFQKRVTRTYRALVY